MEDRNHAGDDARIDRDAPRNKKPRDRSLGAGELHVPEDDAVILTDGSGLTTARFADLSALQRDLLLLLAWSQPSTGAGLKTDLASQQGESVPDPTVYKNLDKLVERGLVEKDIRHQDGRSNSYSLTDRGRRCVRRAAQRATGAADALDQEVA